MKASFIQAGVKPIDPNIFGFISIKLIPETEKEKSMMAKIAANHQRMAEEESDENVAEISYASCSPDSIEMEISFPKPS